jgi:hypothetical protein
MSSTDAGSSTEGVVVEPFGKLEWKKCRSELADLLYRYLVAAERWDAALEVAELMCSENREVEAFLPTWALSRARCLVRLRRETEAIALLMKHRKTVVRQRGSIGLLDDWLQAKFRTSDRKPLVDAIAVFKEVRRIRQKPAHAVRSDQFDPSYSAQQRELMTRAYGAVRVLRLVFAMHPTRNQSRCRLGFATD